MCIYCFQIQEYTPFLYKHMHKGTYEYNICTKVMCKVKCTEIIGSIYVCMYVLWYIDIVRILANIPTILTHIHTLSYTFICTYKH